MTSCLEARIPNCEKTVKSCWWPGGRMIVWHLSQGEPHWELQEQVIMSYS